MLSFANSRLTMCSLGTEVVELKVGSANPRVFKVHKTLLCKQIPYFAKMFNGPWKEASENVGVFPEDSVEAFEILLEWLYNGRLR
jgi:hypothetical protein